MELGVMKNCDSSSNRLKWIDIAKGITIILMVLGHSSLPDKVACFIWSFHMPLFFVASGWCTNWEGITFGAFILNKLKKLGIPFLIYSCVLVLLLYLIGRYTIQELIVNGWQGYALWFIPVLFFSLIISKIILSLHSSKLHYIIAFLLAGLGATLDHFRILIPWAMSSVPYASFFILIGSKSKRYIPIIENPNVLVLIISFALTFFVSYYWRLDIAFNKITPVIMITVGALSGTVMAFIISSYIEKYTSIVSRVLQFIGRETYLVLAFSQVIIILLNIYVTTIPFIKYPLLVIVLCMLKYLKDYTNKVINFKLL